MNTAKQKLHQNLRNTISVKVYSSKELAAMFGICTRTLKKRIKPIEEEIGGRRGNFYTPYQANEIIKYLTERIPQPEPATVRTHPSSIDVLVNATWNFAKCVLWNRQYFTDAEITLAKKHIREVYESMPSEIFSAHAKHLLMEYCERIMQAKEYVDRASNRFIPHPCIWLDKNYAKGFAGTQGWYEQIQTGRLFNENFLSEQKTLAELYADYVMTKAEEVMPKAVQFFNSNVSVKYLNIFSCCIANYKAA